MSDPAHEDYAAPWLIPLAERKRRNANLPRPDMTPLSDEEKRQLRDRLNATGGGRTHLQPRGSTAWMHMTVIRTPEAIRALVTRARTHLNADPEGGEYLKGILQAVAWATGELREGPLTGRIPEGPLPTVSEMEDEERAAVRMMQGRQEKFYVTGVEACLLWLRAGGDDNPL